MRAEVSVFSRKLAKARRRKGSGGSRGLQNRCFGAEASKGWFDSDAPPPVKAEGRKQKWATGILLPSAFCLLPSAFCLLPSALRLTGRLPKIEIDKARVNDRTLLPSAFCLPTSPGRPSGIRL